MKRIVAVLLAAVIALSHLPLPAAADTPPAAEPFPVVALPSASHRSHTVAWLSFGAGAGLLTTSFLVHERANRTYDVYLASNDPDAIGRLYDRTANLDRLSGAALIAGEVLLATGVYLRFLRAPHDARLSLDLSPGRCAAYWRF
jgi:hypothetical protein